MITSMPKAAIEDHFYSMGHLFCSSSKSPVLTYFSLMSLIDLDLHGFHWSV